MRMFLRVAIAMVGMTGLAMAQPKTEAKAADPNQKMAPPAADAKPAMMKPPAEMADMTKATAGTWRCKGQGADAAMKMVDMTATMKMKATLSGWWLQGSFESKMGKDLFTFEQFTSFDPSTKKWKRMMMDNSGGWASGDSAGLKDGKVDWEMMMHSPMMGDAMFRDHEDFTDAKAGAKFWGEVSMDKGKTWNKVYEMTCKK
jgi:hypothetical protein